MMPLCWLHCSLRLPPALLALSGRRAGESCPVVPIGTAVASVAGKMSPPMFRAFATLAKALIFPVGKDREATCHQQYAFPLC